MTALKATPRAHCLEALLDEALEEREILRWIDETEKGVGFVFEVGRRGDAAP